MTDSWHELVHGERWRSPGTVWVEDGIEYSWEQVGAVAEAVAAAIRWDAAVRVAEIRSLGKLGAFAGQLGAWRADCVAVANDGNLDAAALDQVRPGITLTIGPDLRVEVTGHPYPEPPEIPDAVVAVNFTSGSTGRRRAVGVTRANLLALFGCHGLDVPPRGDRLTSGSFATPTYDGWWFDTWRTVAAGGAVVCLPSVNEDVFSWPELAEQYAIDRVLLPAAVAATVIGSAPECIADIPWVFSGGEQFQMATYRQARESGLTNRFVNLYGPTEATFATHRFDLPEEPVGTVIPIGKPLDGCRQDLQRVDGGDRELVVSGPMVCLGYLQHGAVARRFTAEDGEPTYRTGDLVREDGDGNLVFAGRLDGQLKVNGIRVDATALEDRVAALPSVVDCRVAQDDTQTAVFVRVPAGAVADPAVRARIESVVKEFSAAIRVALVDRFPMKSGGKVDTAALLNQHRRTDKGGQP